MSAMPDQQTINNGHGAAASNGHGFWFKHSSYSTYIAEPMISGASSNYTAAVTPLYTSYLRLTGVDVHCTSIIACTS